MDRRKLWEYRGCKITPERGDSRYFGHPDFKPDTGQALYQTRWWKVSYPAGGYILVATKDRVRSLIDEEIVRSPFKFREVV